MSEKKEEKIEKMMTRYIGNRVGERGERGETREVGRGESKR